MNLKQFKSRVSEIDQIIPKNKWFEIPIEDGYWRFFEYQGLYAIYEKNKIIYIGLSSNINLRLRSHTRIDRKFKGQKNISKIKIKISLLDWRLLEYIERRFILRLKPKYNKQFVSRYYLKLEREGRRPSSG